MGWIPWSGNETHIFHMGYECHGFLQRQRTTSPWWYIFACNFKGWVGAFWAHLFGPCLIFFLQTIVIYLLDLIFLQGTKMEAVAYGDQTMRFDCLLRVGECYDFMRVGFAPTHVGPLGYIFCLCANYFVVLSPQSMANAPPREQWICQCPRTFMEFEDV